MTLLWLFITAALVVMALTSILNALSFPRLRIAQSQHTPFVSLLIPARNEAGVIATTIRHLLAQDYPHYEIILLDDHSTDGTSELAQAAAQGDLRLKILGGADLPQGWLGKNWACQQLGAAAEGHFLIFTDADVRWEADALSRLIAAQEKHQAALLTVWPTQITHTWSERLCVPLMALAIMAYLPELLVRFAPFSAFAAANGQCLAFKRGAYQAIGGHDSVKANIVEDVALARRIKAAGHKLVMLDGSGAISCRMYENWAGVRAGFAKNILAGHGNSPLFLLASTLFHWMVFVLPWLALILGGISALWAGALIILGVGVRMLSAAITRQRPLDALLMPLSVLLMTIIAGQALWWRWRYGGPQWKGRRYAKTDEQSGV